MRLSSGIRAVLPYAIIITIVTCQTSCRTYQSNRSSAPIVIQEPKRVIFEGIGLSFQMRPADAEKLGFEDESYLGIKRVGVWGLKSGVGKSDFWGFLKEIRFMPISGWVRGFSGSHFYKKNTFSSELGCLVDYGFVANKIKNKYPTLREVRSPRLPRLTTFDDFHVKLWCEGEKKVRFFSSLESKGTGRCVSLTCMSQVGFDGKRNIGSLLTVQYSEDYIFDTYLKERDTYLRDNQDKLLKERGVPPDNF